MLRSFTCAGKRAKSAVPAERQRVAAAAAVAASWGGAGKRRRVIPKTPISAGRRLHQPQRPRVAGLAAGGKSRPYGLHLRLWPKLIKLTGVSPCGLSVCKYGGALADPHKPSAAALATAPAPRQATSAVGCGLLPWGGL